MIKPKSLHQLISDLPIEFKLNFENKDIQISGLQFDSRKVKPGNLFVAMSGGSKDGHVYIPTAIQCGAVAVLGTLPPVEGVSVPYIQVVNSREALAYLSASFYDHPGRKLTVIGVTGTDGKTTTSNLLFQILKTANIRAGLISTVNAVIGDKIIDTGFHVTTPESPMVQALLAEMVDAGLTHVVLETTSHGLAQHRVTGCEYDIAVVTNITHEHLDYHGSYEEYREAKSHLFLMLAKSRKEFGKPVGLSVLNADDQSYEFLNHLIDKNKCSYSIQGKGRINAEKITSSASGVDFTINIDHQKIPTHCNLPGNFNVSNCLAAYSAAVIGLGVDPLIAAEGLAALEAVSGRMEAIEMGQSFTALVDFAHTPNALAKAIETARQMTRGRVITVFGSAGLRDREKRRMMAEVSARNAEITILTAEDPRTESLEAILAEMADAAIKAGGVEGVTFFRVPDRAEAIRLGVKMAQPGDLLMPCGKGHEQSMCFGTIEYDWDDRTALKAALAESLGIEGPRMPRLPTSNS